MSNPKMQKHLEPLLWLSDARGVYIPRDFATSFADRSKAVANVTDEQWAILETPEHDEYWDVWNEVTDSAIVTDENGNRFTVWQNGDCWLIPEGMIWDDATEFYIWPAAN